MPFALPGSIPPDVPRMVASLEALTLTVLACTEAAATMRLNAKTEEIRIPERAEKEEGRTGVLVFFDSTGTSKKRLGKSKTEYVANASAALNIDGTPRITRYAELCGISQPAVGAQFHIERGKSKKA